MTNVLMILIPLLIAVESEGNDRAVGDGGDSIGCLQIQTACVQDVNRVYGTRYVWPDDCYDRGCATDICVKYLMHYGKFYTVKTGNRPTFEVYSRIWNGGPYGWRKSATDKYWDRVLNRMVRRW